MAVTGFIMFGYIVTHMLGNLKIFLSGQGLNEYAHWLRTLGEPALGYEWFIWIARVVLLAAVVMHFGAAAELTKRARTARPVKYQHRPKVQGSYAARTMRWGGVIILLFIVWHILDLTTGHVNPNGEHLKPYENIVADFQPERWPVTLFYATAVIALGFHLRHGLVSAVQTIGRKSPKHEKNLDLIATAFAVLITVGFLSVPFSVTVGLIK